MRFCTIILAAAAATLPIAVSAQTVTVSKTGPADGISTFNTISDALNTVASNPAEPDVVQVVDSEVYEESISILSPVVLEATDTERATIELLANINGTPMNGETIGNGGIWINLPDTLSTGTVKIRNFNILPALNDTTISTRLRTAIENGNNNLYLEVDNCIITANENHAPLVTNPYTSRIYAVFPGSSGSPEPYNPDIVMYGGHGIVLGRTYTGYAEGDGVELLMKDSVISHLKNADYHAAEEEEGYCTGVVMHSPYGEDPNTWDTSLTRITRIEGASGVSYCTVLVSAAGDLNVEGTVDTPAVFRSSNSYSFRFDGPAFNYRNFNHVTIEGMSKNGILDRGFGPIRWTMNDTRVFMVLERMVDVQAVTEGENVIHAADGLITITNSTLVPGRHHAGHYEKRPFNLDNNSQTDLHFENSILGGRKDQPLEESAHNVIRVAGFNTVTADGCAFITDGPYSLRSTNPFSRGPNATLPTNVVAQYAPDPDFLETADPADPGFLDVQNVAYATLNSTGGPLGGGADYIGDGSSVEDWSVY